MREAITVLLEHAERRAVELDDAHATIKRLQERVAILQDGARPPGRAAAPGIEQPMPAKPPAILVLLLRLVPALPGMIRDRRVEPDIYETVLRVINENRSDAFAEWGHLAAIIRQDQALDAASTG